jgi:hypothetical protein
MNIRTPQPDQAARLLQQFFKAQGVVIKYSQALEAVARLNGYQDLQAMKADIRFADPLSLTAVSSNEYELKEKQHSAWIGVDNISVCVTRNDEGVTVDLFAKGHEDNSLTGTHLFFDEARDAVEDEEGGDDIEVKANPHVLDGPGVWGVRGNPDDFPCGEITLTPAQPCVLFAVTPVDWNNVAEESGVVPFTLTHLRINRGPVRELTFVDYKALQKLGNMKDLSVHLRLSQSPAFEYTVIEAGGERSALALGRLQRAIEYSPGVIDLIEGGTLELLVQGEDGRFQRYSPALGTLVKFE